MHIECKVTIGENGRLVIPTKIRDYYKISPGDQVILVLDNTLTIIPLKNKVRQFQALVKSRNKNNISLVESLKGSRLEEFKNE